MRSGFLARMRTLAVDHGANAAMVFCVSMAVLGHALLISFHGAPATEGWFNFASRLMDHGRFPYRDFHLHVQPVYLLLTRSIELTFGRQFWYLRAYGVMERLFLVALLSTMLSAHYRRPDVALCVLTAFFLSTGFNVDLPYSYYQTTLLVSLLALQACIATVEKHNWSRALLCGFWASMAFFTKQSSGLLLVAFCFGCLLLSCRAPECPRRKVLLAFLGGAILPGLLFFAWLAHSDAVGAWFRSVFLSAKSKGSITTILTGFVVQFVRDWDWELVVLPALGALALYAVGHWHFEPSEAPGNWTQALRGTVTFQRNRTRNYLRASMGRYEIVALIAVSAVFVLAYLAPYQGPLAAYFLWSGSPFFHATPHAETVMALVFPAITLLCVHDLVCVLRVASLQALRDFSWSGFSALWMYGHGMSGNLAVGALLPAAAVVMLRSIATLSPLWTRHCARIIFAAVSAVLVANIAADHYSRPYSWWGWIEGGIRNGQTSREPLLNGLLLHERTRQSLESGANVLRTHTEPQDEVFFFPHTPAYNLLADRLFYGPAPVSYFDVCSDELARANAAYLRARPPKMIVFMRFPETAWDAHEHLFRGGVRSGQREIQEFVDQSLADGSYRVVAETNVGVEGGYPVEFLLRADSHTQTSR